MLSGMAFGTRGSVSAVARVGRTLQVILHKLFNVVVTVYVDDFVVIEPCETARSGVDTVKAVFELLGWAEKPSLGLPSELCVALGVLLDLSRAHEGLVQVRNKPGRVESIRDAAREAIESSYLQAKAAETLHGRVSYASGQAFARLGACASRVIRQHSKQFSGQMTPRLVWALTWWSEFLWTAAPRQLTATPCQRPWVLLTDGAVEPAGTTIGGVLVSPEGRMEHFGLVVPSSLVSRWADESDMQSEHVIGQAELLPVLVAYFIWATVLKNQRVLVFVDNDAARHGLVGNRSGSLANLHIIGAVALRAGTLGLHPWYERVPGPCNVADGPSRLQFSEVDALGSVRVRLAAGEDGLRFGRQLMEWPAAPYGLEAR